MPPKELTSYLFLGEEDLLKEEAVERLKLKFLDKATLALNYAVFYAKDKDFNLKEMLNALNTAPFMSKKRLVVLKDPDSMNQASKESVVSYLKNPQDTSLFVMEDRSAAIKGDFLLEASSRANLVYTRKIIGTGLDTWILRKANSLGKKISADAIGLIKENLPNDLRLLSSALENLSLYTGKRPIITRQDAERMVGAAPSNTSFDLLGAIERKDAKKALTIFSDLQKHKKREMELLGLLSWQFRMLLRVKELLMARKSKAEICGELGIYNVKFDQISRYAPKFNRKDIAGILNDILRTDLDIKTGGLAANLAIERLIVKMCL
ncbi:MAG: DNA polymerase III subunit delta [Candidatus Omnitrophota bacterium]